MPPEKDFISNNGILLKFVREDDKLFHALVPITSSKYILLQVHDALGHNGTDKNYQCLM